MRVIAGATRAWMVAVAAVALGATSEARGQDRVTFEASPYYCGKLGGSSAGRQCTAAYQPDPGSCDKFEAMNPDDARMKQTLNEVRNAQVCISRTVQEAKSYTLRLRADLMGYVSAGRDETRNDPLNGFRAREGTATYWPYVQYLLYQCVVETCTRK